MLAEDGLSGFNLRTLVARCETSTAAVYALFGNKDNLIGDVILRHLQKYADSVKDVELTGDTHADIATLCAGYREWARSNPEIYGALYQDEYVTVDKLDPIREAAMTPWYKVVQNAIEKGYSQDSPLAIGERMWQTLHGGMMLELGNTMDASDRILFESVTAQMHYTASRPTSE